MASTSTQRPLETVQRLYGLILSADEAVLRGSLADDLVVIHQGTQDPGLPFYDVFRGTDGFLQWIEKLFDTVELTLFEPTYFVAEGQRVDVHVREDFTARASGATSRIENLHAFSLTEDLRIRRLHIISDPLTVVASLRGRPGEHFEPGHLKERIDVDDYFFSGAYNKDVAEQFVNCMARGGMDRISAILSPDAVLIVNGDEAVVPYAGRFEGLDAIAAFVEAFSRDTDALRIQAVVSDANRADVHCAIEGLPVSTRKRFSDHTAAAFQFDREGRIAHCFYHMNSYEVRQAYLP